MVPNLWSADHWDPWDPSEQPMTKVHCGPLEMWRGDVGWRSLGTAAVSHRQKSKSQMENSKTNYDKQKIYLEFNWSHNDWLLERYQQHFPCASCSEHFRSLHCETCCQRMQKLIYSKWLGVSSGALGSFVTSFVRSCKSGSFVYNIPYSP